LVGVRFSEEKVSPMPLLSLEPNVFPEDLLENARYSLDGAERWWVLHTRPRTEKCLARRFFACKLPFYLPLRQRRWKCKGRVFKSHMPLFPGYVFLHGDGEVRAKALETNLVAQALHVPDPSQLQADLQRVHRVITTGSPVFPEERLQPGSAVAISQGPLAGLMGKIVRRGKNWRFTVEVRFLHQGVSVDIDGWMIEPVSAREVVDTVSANT
jgi:transcription antitermination factor NusG